jgi:hypothetical protein
MSVTSSGAPYADNNDVYGGWNCAPGTDADTLLQSKMNLHGFIRYGAASGWWVDFTFTGLNPNKVYEFAGSANRFKPGGGNPTNENFYATRLSRITIVGADSFVNSSTTTASAVAGIPTPTIGTDVMANDKYVVDFGGNYTNGYAAHFTNINPGSDGTFTIRVQADSIATAEQSKAYGFAGIKLAETPEPATMTLLAIGGLIALKRRRS